jgi:hypothetical protein
VRKDEVYKIPEYIESFFKWLVWSRWHAGVGTIWDSLNTSVNLMDAPQGSNRATKTDMILLMVIQSMMSQELWSRNTAITGLAELQTQWLCPESSFLQVHLPPSMLYTITSVGFRGWRPYHSSVSAVHCHLHTDVKWFYITSLTSGNTILSMFSST